MNFYPSKNIIDLTWGAANGLSQRRSILIVGLNEFEKTIQYNPLSQCLKQCHYTIVKLC